jgi:hypothetical protein
MLYATIFNVFLAAHDAEDYNAAGGLGIGLMMSMVVVAGVILSNLVISILGDTYDRWQESSAAETLVLRAELCRDSKDSLLRQLAQHLAQLLCLCPCKQAGDGHKSHGGLYVLVPASQVADEEEHGEWSGRLNKLKRHMNTKIEEMKEEMKKQHEEMEEKMEEKMKKQTEEIIRSMKQAAELGR